MTFRMFAAAALALSTGCAAMPSADDPAAAELQAARREAATERVAFQAVQEQNRLLVEALINDHAAFAERADRAELARRIEALERAGAKPPDGGTSAPTAALAPEPSTPMINTTDLELSRLRAKLAESGFGPVTLTPAQVRALLRVLRPPRPIDSAL